MSTTELAEKTGEFTISDELYEISEATNSDGTVNVEIYDYEKVTEGYDQPRIVVYFRTPTLEKESEIMTWPRKDSTEYKFVRICEKTVGSLSAADFLKTDGAEIEVDPDDWTLEASLSKRQQFISNLKDTTFSGFLSALYTILTVSTAITFGLLIIGIPIIGLLAAFGLYPYAVSSSGFILWLASWVGFTIGAVAAPESNE